MSIRARPLGKDFHIFMGQPFGPFLFLFLFFWVRLCNTLPPPRQPQCMLILALQPFLFFLLVGPQIMKKVFDLQFPVSTVVNVVIHHVLPLPIKPKKEKQ